MSMNETSSLARRSRVAALLLAACVALLGAAPAVAEDPAPGRAASPGGASAVAKAPEVTDAFRAAMKRYLLAQGAIEQIGESVAYGAANETLIAIQNSGTEVTEPMQAIVLEEALDSYGRRFGDVDTLARIWAPVYARHFTVSELDQMTAFFQSDVGRKSIELLPVINQEGMQALQQESFAMTPEFQLAVDARFREAGIVGETPKN